VLKCETLFVCGFAFPFGMFRFVIGAGVFARVAGLCRLSDCFITDVIFALIACPCVLANCVFPIVWAAVGESIQ
jgi:hypothetical protein